MRERRGAAAAFDRADRSARRPVRAARRTAGDARSAPPGAWSAPAEGDADLVFDLTGSTEPEPGAIVPLYDGVAGDAARDAALLDGRAPWIELAHRSRRAAVYASALPAVRRRDLLSSGRARSPTRSSR